MKKVGAESPFFFVRIIMGFFLSLMAVLCLVPAVVTLGIKYPNIFDNSETSCSVKIAFCCYLISTGIEVWLFIWQTAVIILAVETDGFCTMRCYHIEILLSYIAFALMGTGLTIFAFKHTYEIWYWYFALGGGSCAGASAFIACTLQTAKRKIEDYTEAAGIGGVENIGSLTKQGNMKNMKNMKV